MEEKEENQISAGSAKNEWYYLCFSKAVGNFCCILRLFLQNVQNRTSTEGRTEDFCWPVPLKARKLTGKLTTGRVLWHAPRKSAFLLVFLAAPDCSNRSEKPHDSEKWFILCEWQVFILERICLCPFTSPFKSIYLQKPFLIIKKQIINAYFKTKSKITEAGKLFEHFSPSYFVCTYFWLQKQVWNWAFKGHPLLKGIEFLLNFRSTVHPELRSDWALPWGLRTHLPDKRENWGQYSWVTSCTLQCTEQIYRVLRIW